MKKRKSEIIILCAGLLNSLTDCKKVFELSKIYFTNTAFLGLGDISDDLNEKIYYVRPGKTKVGTLFKIINCLRIRLKANEATTIYMYYFPGCSLVKLFSSAKFILDIRTGAIKQSKLQRFLFNNLIKLEAALFERIVVISEGVHCVLGLPDRSVVVGLGADQTHVNNQYNNDFAYVGTYKQRNLHLLVEAYSEFLKNISMATGNRVELPKLHIVGDGPEDEMMLVKNALAKSKYKQYIILWGRKEGDQLKNILSQCYFGISYIPITDYFDHQPPTKTLEYIVNGMPVLATATRANLEFVNAENGICCGDTIESFSKGLLKIYLRKDDFSIDNIMRESEHYHWIKIFENGHLKILDAKLNL